MKSVFKVLGLLLISVAPVCMKAQTMEESLTKTYLLMDSAKTVSDMMNISAQFKMTAEKWSNQWIADYYAAYASTITSFMETDSKKKDLLLDEADKYLVNVKLLDSTNAETYILAALIINARIAVDGQSRGRTYGKIFSQYLEKAKSINPDNPRIYYLKGISLFYTPKMFGGGKAKAKPYLEKAKEFYAKKTNTSILKPFWGQKQNQDYLKQCDEK